MGLNLVLGPFPPVSFPSQVALHQAPGPRRKLGPGLPASRVEQSGQLFDEARQPLDVLAQQLVAMVADAVWSVDELLAVARGAYPYDELSREQLEGVLDMLSGRYPSDEFAELRPRVVWDRTAGIVRGRDGARSLAVQNAGTIPDRGLYGVSSSSSPTRLPSPAR